MAMSVPTIVLSLAALAAAALAAWSEAAKRRPVHLASKPFATALIIAVAALAATPALPAYKTLILAGLLCSLAGDIALMFPDKWFTAGLVAFLAAQVLYIFAFKPAAGHSFPFLTFLPFVLYGLLMFFLLAPGLGSMKLPVLIYIGAITTMAVFAAGRYVALGGTKPLLAFAGAVLFLISDSVLAYDRFGRKIGPARILVLATYFPAQLLIALSV